MKRRRMGALALVGGVVLAVVVVGGATGAAREADVTVPNRAAFSFGVATQARSAAAALNGNSAEMRKMIDALKRAGVAARDIQTASVSVSPRYSPNGEDIVGFTASNTVNATIRNASRSGAVIDAAVGAGANQVYGPSFTRSDETVLYRRALAAADAEARGKAHTLARAGKVRLGRVLSIVESSAGPVPLAEKAAAARDAGAPIEPGTQRIEASVTVEFAAR